MTLNRKATIVSTLTAVFLITIKLIVGILTGTISVIASAVDSGLDMIISLLNYFAVREAEKPFDKHYNYGRAKIESLASMLEGIIIIISGLFIIYTAIQKILNPTTLDFLQYAIATMLVSMAVTAFLVKYLSIVFSKTNSMIVRADLLHYKSDLLFNLGVLIALAFVYLTGFVIVDAIISILISLYIIYSAIGLLKDGYFVVMDRSLDLESVEKIKELMKSYHPKVNGFHSLRSRKAGNICFLDAHLVFTKDILLLEAHQISESIEVEIRNILDCKCIINIHLDPEDDEQKELENYLT